MKHGKLFAGGQQLHIDKRLGKGGEGEVFAIGNMPGFAVKMYLPGIVSEREQKIRAMVDKRLADSASTVAFPEKVVVDERGAFAGFLMRLVDKHKEIHELQTPASRQKYFPKADYAFIVRVAINIARVFAQVHASGCVVGDINQRGILVSPTATVALIDADSFQVSDGTRRFPCVVGVPEYTPPELQGKSLKTIIRTIDHDAFGLAVCLFQLLCMDRHPFSGRFTGKGDMPLEQAIEGYRFAYSSRDTGMTPPPGSVRLDDFPIRIGQLFETAFSPNHVGKRPSATTWIEALGELESSLRTCSVNKLHRFSRQAKECPWCRMEREFGRPLFLDIDLVNLHVPKGRFDPSSGYIIDLPSLLSAINGIAIPTTISIAIPSSSTMPKPSKAAEEALSNKSLVPVAKITGLGAIAGAAYAFASGLPGILALVIAGFGGWLLMRNPSHSNELVAEYRKRATILASHVEQLQRAAPIDKVLNKKAEALRALDEYKLLASEFANVKSSYDQQRRQKQLDHFLAQFPIRGGSILKVRSSDVAQLASFGFSTALEAYQRDVQQVHGIGPVKAASIAAWVRNLVGRFQFQTVYTPDDQRNIQKAQNDIIGKQQGLEDRIHKLVGELRQEVLAFERWKATTDPDLLRFAGHLAQAEADLRHVGEVVPSKPIVAPTPVNLPHQGWPSPSSGSIIGKSPQATTTTVASGQAVSCPQCGSRMVKRLARRGARAGRPFWGCLRYPNCKGTRPV